MKFVKLKIKNKAFGRNSQEKEFHEYWCMLLRDLKEVMAFMEFDSEMYSKSLFSMRREKKDKEGNIISNVRLDHLSSNRETVLAKYIDYKIETTPKGELVWPHKVLGQLVTGKAVAMMKAVGNGPLQINESGGWCHHQAFMDLWKPEIVNEIEREGCSFPTDDPPIQAQILIIENGTSIARDIYQYSKKLPGGEYAIRTLTALKEKDTEWVCKSIALSKIIVMETQAVDQIQLDSFMKFFTTIENKEIHIRTINQHTIEEHPLFEINNKKHKVIFF